MPLMKAYKRQVVYGFIIFAVIVFLAVPTAVRVWFLYFSHHKVRDSSPGFSTLWTLSDVTLNTTSGQREDGSAIFLLIQDESLVFVERQRFGGTFLKNLNLQNGKLRWQTNIKSNQRALAIVNDLQRVYIGYSKTPADSNGSTRGSMTISAYDLTSGQLTWSRSYEGISVISKMSLSNSTIVVSGGSGHGAFYGRYLLNADTGKIISSTLSETPIKQGSDRIAFLQRERANGDAYVVRTTKNRIYALDTVNNIVMWQIDEAKLASNFSLSNGIVYFLTQDAELLALDAKSGEPIGNVVFEPGYLSQTIPLNHHVSTNNEVAAVYIADSRSLSVFRLQ